jgi:predicted permease
MVMNVAFLQQTDLSSRKQRVRLLILCALGILLVSLTLPFVLPMLFPGAPKWMRAQYAGGRVVNPNANTPRGLHIARDTLGSSVSCTMLCLKLGTNVWAVRVVVPID